MEMELWMMDLQLRYGRIEIDATAQGIEIEDAKEHTAAAAAALRRTVFDLAPGARGSVTCDRGTMDA
jgi:hypothetical protein